MSKVKYVIGGFLALIGLISIFKGSFLGGLLIGIVGVCIIPAISEKHKEKYPFWRKNVLRRGVLAGLLFWGLVITGIQTRGDNDTNSTPKETTEVSKNKIRVINLDKVLRDANGNIIKPDENDITYRVIEVLDHKKTEARQKKFNFENFHLLIEVSSYKEEDLKNIAFKIKDEYAKFAPDNCNIDLWDDKKAYEKYLAQQKYYRESFDKLMDEFQRTGVPIGDKSTKLKKEWDRKNYPFIADHLPASITLGNDFWYYQLQDDYYKEVGGKNYKK